MAPHNFWLKRQLPGLELPTISDIVLFPPPRETTSTTSSPTERPASSSTPSPSTTSSQFETPAPSASVVISTRPTQTTVEEEEEQQPSASVVNPPTSTTEGILVTAAPTTERRITESLASQGTTSTSVSRTTVVTDVPTGTGVTAQVGAAKGNAFLDNKVLSGVVFAICGVVGLVIICLIVWLATRKARQTKQMEQEIISWDPDHVRGFSNANTSRAGNNADTRSIEELEEKGRGQGSLEGQFTYTLPSQSVYTQRKQTAPGGYSDYHGGQRPIQVTLPPGESQPYRANW